jgi:thioredoxin reductase
MYIVFFIMNGSQRLFDVIIIGGGPAGLSAALILGRSLRDTIVFDAGKPRNMRSEAMHGFISRDGTNPIEFLRLGKEELKKYSVELVEALIVKACRFDDTSFEVQDSSGKVYYSRKILIATGLNDRLPDLPDIEKFYGTSVFHCPYCDGWEVRLKPLAVYAQNCGPGQSVALKNWSDDITVLTDGREPEEEEYEIYSLKGIRVFTDKIIKLEGSHGKLEYIMLENGKKIIASALFFNSDQFQKSDLGGQLGCSFTDKGVIDADDFQQSNIPDVYVAGDATRDMQLIIIAAAEGAKAGLIINRSFQKKEKSLSPPDHTIKLK